MSNYNVIDAQTTAFTAERTALQILGRQFTANVLLIKALGGGWHTGAGSATAPAAYDAGVQLGRLPRTTFLADYFVNAAFRRELRPVLNRGEARGSLFTRTNRTPASQGWPYFTLLRH